MNVSGTASSLTSYYRWHAQIYDATRWAFLFGRSQLIRLAAQHTRPKRILEIGCGTGKNLVDLARAFPNAEITGLDLSPDMLAKARQKMKPFDGRVSVVLADYRAPISNGRPFDLIVFSYCLSMINPGFDGVLETSLRDLAPEGSIAIVDFHDTPHPWFRNWMGINHVRFDGQILAALKNIDLHLSHSTIHSAYGGAWQWQTCLATRR